MKKYKKSVGRSGFRPKQWSIRPRPKTCWRGYFRGTRSKWRWRLCSTSNNNHKVKMMSNKNHRVKMMSKKHISKHRLKLIKLLIFRYILKILKKMTASVKQSKIQNRDRVLNLPSIKKPKLLKKKNQFLSQSRWKLKKWMLGLRVIKKHWKSKVSNSKYPKSLAQHKLRWIRSLKPFNLILKSW